MESLTFKIYFFYEWRTSIQLFSSDPWGTIIGTQSQWELSGIASLESKLQITASSRGGFWFGVDDTDPLGIVRGPSCAIATNPDMPVIGCHFNHKTDEDSEYLTGDVPIKYDTWYMVRIDFDPITQSMSYFSMTS